MIIIKTLTNKYTPKKKYPNDRDFRSRFLTRLVDLTTEGLMLQKNFIWID